MCYKCPFKGKIAQVIMHVKHTKPLGTLVNGYIPNTALIPYLISILKKIQEFKEGITIIGRYFNFILDPLLDSS